MKNLTDVFAPWGKLCATFSDSFDGGGQADDSQQDDQGRRKKKAIIWVIIIIASLAWLYYKMVELQSEEELNSK